MGAKNTSAKDTGKYRSMQEKKQAKKVAGNLEETHGSTLIDTQL